MTLYQLICMFEKRPWCQACKLCTCDSCCTSFLRSEYVEIVSSAHAQLYSFSHSTDSFGLDRQRARNKPRGWSGAGIYDGRLPLLYLEYSCMDTEIVSESVKKMAMTEGYDSPDRVLDIWLCLGCGEGEGLAACYVVCGLPYQHQP